MNDYVFSIKNNIVICCCLLFTNRRFIRAYKSNNENCFSFFDFYIEAFQFVTVSGLEFLFRVDVTMSRMLDMNSESGIAALIFKHRT